MIEIFGLHLHAIIQLYVGYNLNIRSGNKYSRLRDLKPRDLIDIQSLIWMLGSEEYYD